MAVLPLLLFYFGSVSIISPVSNLLVLSLIPAGMLAAFVVGLVGILVPSIVQIFAIPGYVLLHLIYAIIEYFGSLPFALAQARIENPIWLLFAYAIIIDIIFMSWKRINKIKQDGKFI